MEAAQGAGVESLRRGEVRGRAQGEEGEGPRLAACLGCQVACRVAWLVQGCAGVRTAKHGHVGEAHALAEGHRCLVGLCRRGVAVRAADGAHVHVGPAKQVQKGQAVVNLRARNAHGVVAGYD